MILDTLGDSDPLTTILEAISVLLSNDVHLLDSILETDRQGLGMDARELRQFIDGQPAVDQILLQIASDFWFGGSLFDTACSLDEIRFEALIMSLSVLRKLKF